MLAHHIFGAKKVIAGELELEFPISLNHILCDTSCTFTTGFLIGRSSKTLFCLIYEMFNVCRRGPASISRAFSAVVRIPSTRPSTLSLSFQGALKPTLEARWLHVSPLRRQEASAQRYEQPNVSAEALQVDKFHQLIEHDLVHPNVVTAITEGMGHHTMTQVQSLTISKALQGTDM